MTDTTRFEQQEINDVVYLLRNADRPKEVDRLQRHAAAIIDQLLTDNAALREELEQVKATSSMVREGLLRKIIELEDHIQDLTTQARPAEEA